MKKRYQVFVSSTYQDLKEERQQVIQALLELDCFPAGMELFPAADEHQSKLIKKVIDDSDYFIVIIAGKYGSLAASGISYTQMEYEHAVLRKKPVIGFIHSDPGSIPSSKTEQSEKGKDQLANFRRIVEGKMCNYWSTQFELKAQVTSSLVNLMNTRPAIGWVRGNLVPDEAVAREILRAGKVGIDGIRHHLDDRDLRTLLANSKSIRILKTWFPESLQIGDGLEAAIINGATVQLLLCEPGSYILKQRSLGANRDDWWGSFMVYDGVKRVYKGLRERAKTHPIPDNVEVAIYKGWPGCPVIWYDKKILIGFYIRGKSSPAWPWVSVREKKDLANSLSNSLEKQFDELWNDPKTKHLKTLEDINIWLEDKKNKKWGRLGVVPERSTE